VRIIKFNEFMAAAGLTSQLLKTLRRRDQLALAFGRRDVYASLNYIELDAVAVGLVDDLSASFDRTFAAQLIRTHCDVWAHVIAQSESTKGPHFFAVVEFERRGQVSHLVAGASTGDPQQIMFNVSAQPQAAGYEPLRTIAVNVTHVTKRVRANARRGGFDFSNRFLPPPGDPRFSEIFEPYKEARDRAVATVKARNHEELARSAGVMARAVVEAGLDDPRRQSGRLQGRQGRA
jgi:hypothetical protein